MRLVVLAFVMIGMAGGSVALAPPPVAAARGAGPVVPVVFTPPLVGHLVVTRPFQPPTTRYGAGHRGVDLAGIPGSSVLSAGPGIVTFAGAAAGVLVVAVTHPDGIRTTYEPLATIAVHAGSVVVGGARLGSLASGHPGCSAPPGQICLHWGALLDSTGAYLDPLLLLAGGAVTLLPPLPWPASGTGRSAGTTN